MAAGSQAGMASGMADSQPQGLPGAVHWLVEGAPPPALTDISVNPDQIGDFGGVPGLWRML